jgi:hypothetical protein
MAMIDPEGRAQWQSLSRPAPPPEETG